MARLKVPRWLVAILWPALLFLVYAGLPAGLADVGPRHGWRAGRPGPLNLLGLVLLVPGLLSLGWITYRHLASSPKRIEVPQPAPEYLLTDGMYQWSRHPMYVAGITTWVGWAIYYGGLAVMAGALLFASAIAFIAVPYEERELQARFGEAYSRYRASVPRWFGLPRSR